MRIDVVVKTSAQRVAVERLSDGTYKVSVNEKPVEGRANKAVADALSRYFMVSKSLVSLVQGAKAKHKVFDIGISS